MTLTRVAEVMSEGVVVNTIAELRMVTGKDNSSAEVLGYYEAGDGGGGPTRVWKDGGTYVDNGGSIIVPTGGNGSAAWVFTGTVIDVKWFGAKGDGVTDDSTAVQSAVNAASANNPEILVPYTASGYLISSVLIPSNNIHFKGGNKTLRLSGFVHSETTGKMFYQETATEQQHSIIFENLIFTGNMSRTTSVAIYIADNITTGVPFNIKFYNCYFDNFAIGVYVKRCFHSHFERMQFDNCDVGFYGAHNIDNIFVNCVPRTIPANGIGMWICSSSSLIQSGDTGSADSGAGAYQYLIGNDSGVVVPTNAAGYITAFQQTAFVKFNSTHFEFSDLAGLGTVQAAFVRVGYASQADFDMCQFMNRTPNLPCAIEFAYFNKLSRIMNCSFALGPANVAPGNGSYNTAMVSITAKTDDGCLDITPYQFSDIVTVSGGTAADIVSYKVSSYARVSKNALQVVANGATDLITWELSKYNNHHEFDFDTEKFTATQAGFYRVTLSLLLGDATNPTVADKRYRLKVYKNGGLEIMKDADSPTTNPIIGSVAGTIYLEAGDYLQAYLTNGYALADINIGNNDATTYFMIEKVN